MRPRTSPVPARDKAEVVHILPSPKIDGAALLDEVCDTLMRYIIFPRPEAVDAYTLWIAATHRQPAWEHATRFVFKSPIKRCGKTRASEIGRELVHNPISTTNISVTALVRSMNETDPPTLFIDEADAIFGKKGKADGAEDLRGILNSGHSRGWPYIRWDLTARRREECNTFGMAALAGIGDLPDTLEDRAIVVSMRRRAPGEPITPFRRRRVVPRLHELRERLREWTGSLEGLADIEPDLPVDDREGDVWEPLVAIADVAGGHWPKTARAACIALCGARRSDDGTAGERLLADIKTVWADDAARMFTSEILERLHKIDEAPWGDWYGRPLSARGLAKLLGEWGIESKNIRIGEQQAKGYLRAELADSWDRYVTSVPPSQGDESAGGAGDGSGTDDVSESVPSPEQGELTDRDAGTAGTGVARDGE